MEWVIVFVALLAASIWVGGLVAITVVTRVARSTVGAAEQVDFFRRLGRDYGIVSSVALLFALIAGGILLSDQPWESLSLAAVILAIVLVLSLVFGVLQARAMSRLRRSALLAPDDTDLSAQVRRDSARATQTRAAISLLSIALLAVAAALAV